MTVQQHSENEWIEWEGGECPVDDHALVSVRIRDRETWAAADETAEAYTWSWAHIPDDADQDIVAYRVVEQAK